MTPPNQLRPSLAATTLATLAMLTLLATTRLTAWVLLVCMGALVATHLTRARLDRSSYVPLLARLVLFPTIFALSGVSSIGIDWIFDTRTLFALGQAAAIELCLQHWKHTPSEEGGRFPAASILLSCLVYLASANTYFQGFYIPSVTPLFMVALAWALLDWKPGRGLARSKYAVATCWALALASGWGLHATSMYFKNELMSVGSQFFQNRLIQVAGISNRPRLSSRFRIEDSPRRVLRVEGTLNDPHLRAASFSDYDNGTWGPALSSRSFAILDDRKKAQQLNPDAPGTRARITYLVEMPDTPLFVPLNAAGVAIPESASPDGASFELERESGLLRCDEAVPFAYEVIESEKSIAGVPTNQGPLAIKLTGELRKKYLNLPHGFDPRVTQVANEATLEADTPAERVEALGRYLMSNHSYALDVQVDPSRGPISQFILEKKAAHCEFFAAAMALMCRSVGVPARYAVGYLAHEPALGEPGVTNVRQRDAHAWAEVWIDGVGWVVADATPGDGRPEAREAVSPGQRLGERLSDFIAWLRNRAVRIDKRTWAWIIGLPLAVWVLLRARPQARRARARDARGYATADGELAERLDSLARDFEKYLSSQKLSAPPARSWSWFLAREQSRGLTPAQQWAREYESARFGAVDEATVARLEHGLRELRSSRAA